MQFTKRGQELALSNPAIDSKLCGYGLVRLRVADIAHGSRIASHAIIMQRKTRRPVQFELTELSGNAVAAWIAKAQLSADEYPYPRRLSGSPYLSTPQYVRVVES